MIARVRNEDYPAICSILGTLFAVFSTGEEKGEDGDAQFVVYTSREQDQRHKESVFMLKIVDSRYKLLRAGWTPEAYPKNDCTQISVRGYHKETGLSIALPDGELFYKIFKTGDATERPVLLYEDPTPPETADKELAAQKNNLEKLP